MALIFEKKVKDPVCGMLKKKGEGIEKNGRWFCSTHCLTEYEKKLKQMDKQKQRSCC
ncbi:MAG: hypothetical protein QXU40_01125 [Candidatus Pacearchaeota archaeon]